jgi:threonylcarbamoyladenosine tRNA methylthiotransferase MtaB
VRVLLRTFGCRANQYDTEAVRSLVEGAGHSIAERAEDADAAVFNSCAVTAHAQADLRKEIRRAARANPELRSIVMGCASGLALRSRDASAEADSLRALPSVAAIVAGADVDAVASALGIESGRSWPQRQRSTRALLRIQDGCDEHCTFCATTIARGRNRSRAVHEIVEEARTLADAHPEIVLTGVHIGTFGQDIGSSLSALVEQLVDAIPRVRFRLTSVEATEVDDRLADLLVDSDGRLAPSLHAPLQSGSDRILRRMGRHWYTAASYARAIESMGARRAVLGFGADVIAGFPGETEEDHSASMDLIRSLPLTYLHVFPYSPRPGTAAPKLGGEVASGVIACRAGELRALGEAKAAEYANRRHCGAADVIVVGGATHGMKECITEDYLTLRVAQPLPRGTRTPATLYLDGSALVAHPHQPAGEYPAHARNLVRVSCPLNAST